MRIVRKYLLTAFWVVGFAFVVATFFIQAEVPKIVTLILGVNVFMVGFCADLLSDKIDDLIAAQPKKPVAAENESTSTEK